MDMHGNDPSCPFRYFDLVECRREPGVCSVVDCLPNAVDVDVLRDADHRVGAPHQVVRNTKDDRPAATVGHAYSPFDGFGQGCSGIFAPLLEVDVLSFKFVR